MLRRPRRPAERSGMEKRGRSAKPSPSPAPPSQPSPGPRKDRKPSMFEKEAVSAAAPPPLLAPSHVCVGGFAQKRAVPGPE